MSEPHVDFQSIDLRAASDHEYTCLGAFKNVLDRERLPDDPPTPLEEQIQDWRNIPAFFQLEDHIGWNASHSEVVAECGIGIRLTGDNEHIANAWIEVLPQYRCQRLGTKMLRMLLPFAKEHHRRLLMIWSNGRIPAGEAFMQRIGARRGQEGRVNQLKVSELDRDLIHGWLQQSEHLDLEFEMGLWHDAYPEERLEEIAAEMQELANDQPRDDLDMEDWKITAEFIRQVQTNILAMGDQIWTLYVTDRTNQKLVGWTEVYWNPNRPMILNQGFTAVDENYRNRGLGRWLKARMIQKVLYERPQVEFIRTRNANSNAPMLKINHEMGFQPYNSITAWQVSVEQVEEYLSTRE